MTTTEPVTIRRLKQSIQGGLIAPLAPSYPATEYSVVTQSVHPSFLPPAIQFDEPERIRQAIRILKARCVLLGDDVVNATLIALQQRMIEVDKRAAPHQRKQATVLFADVSGFTALSESLDAEDVHTIINALWKQLDSTIHRWNGAIDKHIGDAVMALFGASVVRENDPELAVRAALDMQQELAKFNETLWEMGFQDANLQMRIGINTGPVLVGEVGTIGEYTAMGDTVNLAGCLESAAPIGGILISQNTYLQVTGIFITEPQAPLYVKEKIDPVRTYVVKETKPSAHLVPNRGLEGIIARDTNLLLPTIQFDEPKRIRQAIDVLNAQRALLGDDIVDTALIALQKRMMAVDERVAPYQRKQTTVLFADISGFTAFSESLDAGDVHIIINALWERNTLGNGFPERESADADRD